MNKKIVLVIIIIFALICLTLFLAILNKKCTIIFTLNTDDNNEEINAVVTLINKKGQKLGMSVDTTDNSSAKFIVKKGVYKVEVTDISDENYSFDGTNIDINKDMKYQIKLEKCFEIIDDVSSTDEGTIDNKGYDKVIKALEEKGDKKLDLPGKFSNYDIEIFENENKKIDGSDCYIVGAYADLGSSKTLMATFAVSKDYKHVYKFIAGEYKEVK